MRGGAQAHLLEAEDGCWYVVKFKNNPQHRRILVNEWVAATFLRYLNLAAAPAAVIEITAEFLAANPEVAIQLGSRTVPVTPGWHFGSQYPGDPASLAVYDFLPDSLLVKVANLGEFPGMLVFDKWMSNADARQAVFFRAEVESASPVSDGFTVDWFERRAADPPKAERGRPAGRSSGPAQVRRAFVAHMIDHGYVFDGPNWTFTDSPLQGLYFRPTVYAGVTGWPDFDPWLDRVMHFPESMIDEALRQVPAEWLDGDSDSLEALLEKLLARRKRVASLIEDCTQGKVNLFPNWR